MAGCRPEHMPILIAAVKAMGDPAFRLSMSGGSTHSFVHFYLVNGPLARQLQIDHGQGLIAHSTNQVIGRALGLIERNIAGFRIKETQMGTFRQTAIVGLGGRRSGTGEDRLGSLSRGERLLERCKHGCCSQQHHMGAEPHSGNIRT